MLVVLMKPAHRQRSVPFGHQTHTRQTHVRPHNQDETRVRTHRRVASHRLRAAKRRAGGTSHFAHATRCCYKPFPTTMRDPASDSWKLSWTLAPRKASLLLDSFRGLWSRQPCPRLEAATESQTATESPTLDSRRSVSRQTKVFQLACCSRPRKSRGRLFPRRSLRRLGTTLSSTKRAAPLCMNKAVVAQCSTSEEASTCFACGSRQALYRVLPGGGTEFFINTAARAAVTRAA